MIEQYFNCFYDTALGKSARLMNQTIHYFVRVNRRGRSNE